METREFSEKLYQDPRYDVGGLTGSCRQASEIPTLALVVQK